FRPQTVPIGSRKILAQRQLPIKPPTAERCTIERPIRGKITFETQQGAMLNHLPRCRHVLLTIFEVLQLFLVCPRKAPQRMKNPLPPGPRSRCPFDLLFFYPERGKNLSVPRNETVVSV